VEKGVEITEEKDVAPILPDVKAPSETALYDNVRTEVEEEKERRLEQANRIKRFNSLHDVRTPEEFKSSLNTAAIKNVTKVLCKGFKKEEAKPFRNSWLPAEQDDLDVPTFLRQQMD